MASNFEKRKVKEIQKQQEEQTVASAEAEKTALNRTAVDIVDVGNDKFVYVEVKYNLETGEAEVAVTKPASRMIGLGWDIKKKALMNLNKTE